MQIVFAVLLLAYSLLLSMGRFEARAEKMQACGIILSRLLREIKPLKDGEPPASDGTYNDLSDRYYDCLEKFENHKEIDYYGVMIDLAVREGMPPRNNRSISSYCASVVGYYWRLNMRRIYVYSIRALVFGHYFLAIAVMYAWIYFLTRADG